VKRDGTTILGSNYVGKRDETEGVSDGFKVGGLEDGAQTIKLFSAYTKLGDIAALT
jgi:hypothetical protein